MSTENQGTVRIKWKRSGIGFHRQQAEAVRSLGLRRLNHVVERPDNAQIRGLVAKVAHLVEIVAPKAVPAWTLAAGYTVKAPEIKAAATPQTATEVAPEASGGSEAEELPASSEGS